MRRCILSLLLFTVVASWLTIQSELPSAAAQDKKAKKKQAATAEDKDDESRVLPVFDTGAHTRAISSMGFTKDGSKLITVGEDFTIQVWAAATGQRLDILRLPGYGREKSYDAGRWDVSAVSPDGARVVIGGQAKFLFDIEDKAKKPVRLIMIDVPNRRVKRMQLKGNTLEVKALAFSRDGETLAVGLSGKAGTELFVVGGVGERLAEAGGLMVRTTDCTPVATPHSSAITAISFSPDGKKLLLGGEGTRLTLWDLPEGPAPTPKLAKEITAEGTTNSLDWSPDGKYFARAANGTVKSGMRSIEQWNVDGTRAKVWKLTDMPTVFVRPGKIHTVRYLDKGRLYFVAHRLAGKTELGGPVAGMIDLATGKDLQLMSGPEGILSDPVGAASGDGKLVACTVTGNTEVLIGASAPDASRVRCGTQGQLSFHVGWAKDPAKPGFAWTTTHTPGRETPSADLLRFGFDLTKIEPVGDIQGADYLPSLRKLGDWTLESLGAKPKVEEAGRALLKQNDQLVRGFPIAPGIGYTLVPNGAKPPLVAYATHIAGSGDGGELRFSDYSLLTRLLPRFTRIHSMAASPDGRYVIATTGTPRTVIYRTDGSSYPFLSFAQLNGEWVLWTAEGYYAASPGGEKMFGWAVNNGPNALVTFHPAEKFAQHYRRPDLIKLAIEKGSVHLAIEALKAKPADVEAILPPTAELKLVKQAGKDVVVRARAHSSAKDKPVVALRLLLDGRPLPESRGVLKVEQGKPAEAQWDITIPGGAHELKLLARSDAGSAVSDALIVVGPKSAGQQPTIHRLCVGINEYEHPGLKLNAAVKDASAVFDSFDRDCTGPYNRFGSARGQLLLDKDATRANVLKGLAAIRKDAKPGDLVVLFFAGHGVKQGSEFYLLTREADTSKSLKGLSLSGEDLRKALSDIECPVLLIMDACHSAKSVKSFRPATDDLTRSLTDESAGVTILAAAMAHEVANANAENGYFTAALLKALKAETGVPFDPYERALYTHHIYSVVFSEVRQATSGRQNPFLNSPWTVPPLAVRDVLKP